MRLLLTPLMLLAACADPEPQPIPSVPTSGGTPVGTPAGTPPGSTSDSGTAPGSTTTEPPLDCTVLPPMPLANFTTLSGFSTAEDFDFDPDGYAVSEYQTNVAGKDLAGNVKVITADIGSWTAGTRTLRTGDIVIAVPAEGNIKLVDPLTGAKSVILGGMAYPNGVDVDLQDNVYVADQTNSRVIRVNAYNPDDSELIATGLNNPNGVILSPDDMILYVGSFGGGVIYAIDKDPVTLTWGAPRILVQSPTFDMGYDGINVDRCGNVYWTEYIVGKVRRVTPDGATVSLVADLPSSWIPNLRWGHDIGGWRNDVLYVSDRDQGRIFGLEVGIPGKKHVLMP